MADEQHTQVQESADAPAQEETAQGSGVDWKTEARKWEDRAKANRDEAKALKTQLAALQDTSGQLEDALKRITVLETDKAALKHDSLVREVAEAKGVTAALLHGKTREELEANADALLAWRQEAGRTPAAPLLGGQPSPYGKNTADAENMAFLRRITGKE